MRKNHTPYFIYRLKRWINKRYTLQIIIPQFESIGKELSILKPHTVKIFGRNIIAGDNLHIISSRDKPVNISCWSSKQQQGNITIGNNVLISPGVSISSAEDIVIGDNSMIAADVYISDSDWHHIYNRTRPFRCSKSIELGKNCWIGYRATITKGIRIGKNSVVAAGAVVINDVPDNTVVGGNPAKVIKTLDPTKRMISRDFLFSNESAYDQNQDKIQEYLLDKNSLWSYIKSKFCPTKTD